VADHARSDDRAVQAQLNRFAKLSPGRDILGLDRITALMTALGDPHLDLPPVFHVAGTNGKGSTCAFLRAAIEAAGLTTHVYTSPHLARFNERIRLSGSLITDAALAPLLREVLDVAAKTKIRPSFFEATTAAAFLAFARTPADAAIIEVGLGGRLDATNIIVEPAVCGIAQLGIDHQAFLGWDSSIIAGEKAGIAKRGVPLVTMAYAKGQTARIASVAAKAGAPLVPKGVSWDSVRYEGALHYRDKMGKFSVPIPSMPGAHQEMNASLAIAMLRHQSAISLPQSALKAAMGWTHWPARLQRLANGPLVGTREVWLDGGHNKDCGRVVAEFMRERGDDFHIITGILANKDATGLLGCFGGLSTRLTAIPVPGHPCFAPHDLVDIGRSLGMECDIAPDVPKALARSDAKVTLIIGSLYIAGDVLRANNQVPD
jgi:dihydrofolate synthase / folylpolyglutamate synthase